MRLLRNRRRTLFVVALLAATSSVLLAAALACGPPASFDGLVGGLRPPLEAGVDGADEGAAPVVLRPDDTLPPPRPIGPSTSTWTDSTRPHFRWQHSVTGAIGARVELCRSRACDTEKKIFEAGGTELLLPEDLSSGMWFWRLYGKTAETFGTKPSVTWQLLVRAGKGTGLPSGSIFDFNGDGRPDLIATVEYEDQPGQIDLNVVVLVGQTSDLLSYSDQGDGGLGVLGFGLFLKDTSIGVGDFDGDGFADFAIHDRYQTEARRIYVAAGSASGLDTNKLDRFTRAAIEETPILASGGDLDGDGYSDLVVSTKNEAYAVFGTDKGLGPFQFLIQVSPVLPPDAGGATLPTKPLAAAGVLDQNGDGVGDLILTEPYSELPALLFLGSKQRVFTVVAPEITTTPLPKGADPIATGDFDGDGHPDIAFATTSAGKPAVCVQLASEPAAATKLTCWVPEPSPPLASFAVSMTVGDVDPDDRDDIIVGSASGGIDILRLSPSSGLVAQHIPTAFGAQVTTLFPGRPGPAVWAALREDGSAIAIFKGAEQQFPFITPPAPAKRFGKRLR